MRAGELCSQPVVTIAFDETVVTAAKLMRNHHVGDVVVVVGHEGQKQPVGILTDRDIVVGLVAQDVVDLPSIKVRDVMPRGLVVAREEDDLSSVIQLMQVHSVRRLPVVSATGTLVGIICHDDIIRHLSRQMSDFVSLNAHQRELERARRP